MRNFIIGTAFLVLLSGTGFAEDTTLWNKLVDVAIQHIKTNGPDAETGQFVSMARHHAWPRRQEFVDLVIPHLKGKDPNRVAGALDILHWLRFYLPMGPQDDFEKIHHDFFAKIDKIMYGQLEHLHSLNSDTLYHSLAIYLGCSATAESKRHLLKIVKSPVAKVAKEQALICLAWHRDPNDMESLLPFMLEYSQASRSLPYHFRNSYGKASLPYLRKAVAEAESGITKREAEKELKILEKQLEMSNKTDTKNGK